MSVAYFVVLDKQVDFETFVNGKAIAHAFDELNAFCIAHDLKSIEDFHSQDISEFMEGLDDIEIQGQDLLWFDAQEGIDWANGLIDKLGSESPEFKIELIIEDLEEYIDIFKKAKAIGAKWHLEIDY